MTWDERKIDIVDLLLDGRLDAEGEATCTATEAAAIADRLFDDFVGRVERGDPDLDLDDESLRAKLDEVRAAAALASKEKG